MSFSTKKLDSIEKNEKTGTHIEAMFNYYDNPLTEIIDYYDLNEKYTTSDEHDTLFLLGKTQINNTDLGRYIPVIAYYCIATGTNDEGWMHKDEEWKDYFVVHECTINGQPYIFKYTHPTLKELRAFQSDWVKDCKTLIRLNADEESGFYLIENVIARYYLGGVFDLCFNGDADNLPLRMERTFNGEAYDIYYELMDSMRK